MIKADYDRMNYSALVTVVIPVYNRTVELCRALKSLSCQTRQDFDVLVCDDGSDQDVAAVVGQFASCLSVKLLKSSHSGGPALPRNYGVLKATTPWISFLDSDDWWEPDRLEVVYSCLDLKYDVIYHRMFIQTLEDSSKISAPASRLTGFPPGQDGMLSTLIRKENPIPLSSALVQRRALLNIGLFDTNLNSVEDYDLWVRLALSGSRFKYIDQALGYYAIGPDSISLFSRNHIDVQVRFFNKTLASLTGRSKAVASSYFAYLLSSYALRINDLSILTKIGRVSFLIHPVRWLKLQLKFLSWILLRRRVDGD